MAVVITYIATVAIGDDYQLSAWVDMPAATNHSGNSIRGSSRPLPPSAREVTLHILNAGKIAIGDQKDRWSLQIDAAPGVAMQYQAIASVRKKTLVTVPVNSSGSSLVFGMGLLPSHAEVGIQLLLLDDGGKYPHFTLHSSLIGLPQPEIDSLSPRDRLFRLLCNLLFPPFTLLMTWEIIRNDRLKRAGLLQLSKPPHTLIRPPSRLGFAVLLVFGSPTFAALATLIVARAGMFVMVQMLDFGLLD